MPFETGGGIFRALPLLGDGPFLVVNGDVWTDIDFGALTLEPQALAHLMLIRNPVHHPRGDFGLEDGWLTAGAAERFTYSGVGVYRPQFFAGCEAGRFPLLPLLNRAIAARRLRGELLRRGVVRRGHPGAAGEPGRAPAWVTMSAHVEPQGHPGRGRGRAGA